MIYKDGIYLVTALALTSFYVMAFYTGKYINIEVIIAIMIIALMFSIKEVANKKNGNGIVLICLIALYLPYSSLLSYINFNFDDVPPKFMFGLATNPYVLNKEIVELTAVLGLIGMIGAFFGIVVGNINILNKHSLISINTFTSKSLPIKYFVPWVLFGFLLSSLSAPSDSILTAAYTESAAALQDANFSSSWMVSYCIMIYAYADYRFDKFTERKVQKAWIFWIAFIWIIIFHQLLRGDRESMTMVVGMLISEYYYIENSKLKMRLKDNKFIMILTTMLILVVANIVGVMRSLVVSIEDLPALIGVLIQLNNDGVMDFSRNFKGTWNAVFLTPISVVGDYLYGVAETRFGMDYLDLMMSIPPGFIADFFGYVRPWSTESNPAWNMSYGIGGWYFLVLPFMNFEIFGVFTITALVFSYLCKLNKKLHHKKKAEYFAFINIVLMAIPHWFWYGEKAIVNALIISALLLNFYRILSTTQSAIIKSHSFWRV